MPRKGYRNLTVREDVFNKINKIRKELGFGSVSDTIIYLIEQSKVNERLQKVEEMLEKLLEEKMQKGNVYNKYGWAFNILKEKGYIKYSYIKSDKLKDVLLEEHFYIPELDLIIRKDIADNMDFTDTGVVCRICGEEFKEVTAFVEHYLKEHEVNS